MLLLACLTVEPIMPWRCTELSKLTSPSLWNLTVDLAARFSQTFFTRASFHRGEEVWLKSFNFQSFFALKIIILYFKTQLSAWNRSIFFLQDLSSRFELAYSALDSVKPAALVGNTVLEPAKQDANWLLFSAEKNLLSCLQTLLSFRVTEPAGL